MLAVVSFFRLCIWKISIGDCMVGEYALGEMFGMSKIQIRCPKIPTVIFDKIECADGSYYMYMYIFQSFFWSVNSVS